MTENELTIVCCYNDDAQYRRLTESLSKQNIGCDLIGIDNCNQKYASCSKALNSVIHQITTKYVIYAHQDIVLPENTTLEKYVGYLEQIKKNDILGVAGIAPLSLENGGDQGVVLSNVRHGSGLALAGEKDFSGMVICDTIDECFFGGYTECFLTDPFNEELCDNWHMYAVERCLHARAAGHKVYVCDIPLLHYSGGHINHAYNLNFRRIAAHYAKQMQWIRTVCGSARTDFLHRTAFYLKREILIRLRRYES